MNQNESLKTNRNLPLSSSKCEPMDSDCPTAELPDLDYIEALICSAPTVEIPIALLIEGLVDSMENPFK